MAQYDKKNVKYVDRNNNLFDVNMLSDENGELWNVRYAKDAWGRPKTVSDFSLFSATWTFGVPERVWEENEINASVPSSEVYTPQVSLVNSTMVEHMLSVVSGTVVNIGYGCLSKDHPRYQPNRGHIFSTTATCPTPTANGIRRWGLSSGRDGVLFQFEGDGVDWDIFAVRKRNGAEADKISIKEFMPADFDPSKGHVYDIQYEWRGVGDFFFFVDLKLVYTLKILGTLDYLSVDDPALPVEFASICTEAGTQVQLLAGCVDVSSEGGADERNLFGSVTTGKDLVTLGNTGIETAILALKIPRLINYNGTDHYNSRGVSLDKLVTWTRDESLTIVYKFRDIAAPTLNGLTWNTVNDSNVLYLNGSTGGILDTAFVADIANGQFVVSEWADIDFKNEISNPARNSDFHATPGDIVVIAVKSTGAANVKSSAALYYSEEI